MEIEEILEICRHLDPEMIQVKQNENGILWRTLNEVGITVNGVYFQKWKALSFEKGNSFIFTEPDNQLIPFPEIESVEVDENGLFHGVCWMCGGSGIVEVYDPSKDMRIPFDCEICKGKGMIE